MGNIFDDIFGNTFNDTFAVVVVTKNNQDSVIRALNEKFRAAIFYPDKKTEYDHYLAAVKRSSVRVFRDKSGCHKLVFKEENV